MAKFVAMLAAAFGLAAAPAAAESLSVACSALGKESELCRSGAEAWARQTGNEVRFIATPNSETDRFALYLQMMAAQSPDIDVFQIDIIWPGLLAPHLLDLSPYLPDGLREQHFPAIIENNTVDGQLVALPWFVDAGLLYYRKDLLERYGQAVPEQWSDLEATARKIQDAERAAGNGRIWGFVFQGRAYEGLTVNALEWIASFGGGTLVDDAGRVTVNNPRAAAAIDLVASWIGGIAPEGVLSYTEEESRGVFQSGNAVFMRNWPYAWALANAADSPIRGKVGVAPLPRGGPDGRHAAALGGQQLAVSRYSAHPELAADLVLFLAGAAEQKRRAIEGSFNPTIADLYRDPEILQANPFMGELSAAFADTVARPSRITGSRYSRVSAEVFGAVHATLSGNGDAATNLAALESQLNALSRNGRW
ncbi:MAG: ABC transporter substrate-binding protein [Dongiaceae bacterium]